MEIIFNECSLHGQFQDAGSFESSLELLMLMRDTARRYDREIHCNRQLMHSMVTHQLSLPQIIGSIDRNKASALRAWIGRTGPYWNEPKQHSPDEYFESQNQIVTDTAIGECAYRCMLKNEAQLASITPSDWSDNPITVTWHCNEQKFQSSILVNHSTSETLELELQRFDPPVSSWSQMADICKRKFKSLSFCDETFLPLDGVPFVYGAANSMIELLTVLNDYKNTHSTDQGRSKVGDEMYQNFFTGPRAWFSDSSAREKVDFRNEMSFTHPDRGREKVFAPYHGKVQTPQMRIHFSWPITAGSPVYIYYIGEKITKY